MDSAMHAQAPLLEELRFGGGSEAALTVSQLAQHLKTLVTLDDIAGDVWVRGELSSVTQAASGHLYFSL